MRNFFIKKKKEERKIWRQNYLQSIGIDVKNDNVKKDLLKSIFDKKKETKEGNSGRLAEILCNGKKISTKLKNQPDSKIENKFTKNMSRYTLSWTYSPSDY